MNSTLKFLCIAVLTATSGPAFTKDMSGWSDKTVCRIANQANSQEITSELATRGLTCEAGLPKVIESSSNIKLREVPKMARSNIRNFVVPAGGVDFLDEEKIDKFIARFGFVAQPLSHMFLKEAECSEVMSKFPISMFNNQNDHATESTTFIIECRHAAFNRYINNPYSKLKPIEDILLYWSEHKTVKYPSQHGPEHFFDTQHYSSLVLTGDFASFYATFYDRFKFTNKQRQAVDLYFENWMANQDLDPRPGKKRCDLSNPLRITGRDHNNIDVDNCGSNRWRMALGGVLLGLKTGNQRIFDAGVRHLEVALAMIGPDGLFIPWSNKGGMSLSYSRQLPEVLSILGVAFKHLDYDFYEHKTPQGKKIHEVYETLFKAIYDPEMLYKHSKYEPIYAGVSLKEMRNLPLEDQWTHEYIDLSMLVQASREYILRYQPELSEYLVLERHWSPIIDQHLYQFPGASGVMILHADKKALDHEVTYGL